MAFEDDIKVARGEPCREWANNIFPVVIRLSKVKVYNKIWGFEDLAKLHTKCRDICNPFAKHKTEMSLARQRTISM